MFDNLLHRQQNEREELLLLMHRLIAKLNVEYEAKPHQNVCQIVVYILLFVYN